jgi:hypothetical protein
MKMGNGSRGLTILPPSTLRPGAMSDIIKINKV